ncbi:MAG: hypothetical protein RIB32_04140 [Phycisphaerales bacterium]
MPPDLEAFHRSIADELVAVKDRLRNLVEHWPTDGEHKEAALRAVLRRHMGDAFAVVRGFVVDQHRSSGQIDLMIVDRASPTLFRDGDLCIVTPDAVRAVIEVKTRLDGPQAIQDAVQQLRERVEHWGSRRIWTGLFVFDGEERERLPGQVLEALATDWQQVPVDAVSVGASCFVRWWPKLTPRPTRRIDPQRSVWRTYSIDRLAPAYFIGNLLDYLSPTSVGSNGRVWFPISAPGGKENFAGLEIGPDEHTPRNAARPDQQDLPLEEEPHE